jgi:hypothetical protein
VFNPSRYILFKSYTLVSSQYPLYFEREHSISEYPLWLTMLRKDHAHEYLSMSVYPYFSNWRYQWVGWKNSLLHHISIWDNVLIFFFTLYKIKWLTILSTCFLSASHTSAQVPDRSTTYKKVTRSCKSQDPEQRTTCHAINEAQKEQYNFCLFSLGVGTGGGILYNETQRNFFRKNCAMSPTNAGR